MQPVTPIVPGYNLPVTEFAKTQAEYQSLPAFRQADGAVLTRWHLSWRERLRVLCKGDVYLSVLTFNRPLQPIALEVEPPEIEPTVISAQGLTAEDLAKLEAEWIELFHGKDGWGTATKRLT